MIQSSKELEPLERGEREEDELGERLRWWSRCDRFLDLSYAAAGLLLRDLRRSFLALSLLALGDAERDLRVFSTLLSSFD